MRPTLPRPVPLCVLAFRVEPVPATLAAMTNDGGMTSRGVCSRGRGARVAGAREVGHPFGGRAGRVAACVRPGGREGAFPSPPPSPRPATLVDFPAARKRSRLPALCPQAQQDRQEPQPGVAPGGGGGGAGLRLEDHQRGGERPGRAGGHRGHLRGVGGQALVLGDVQEPARAGRALAAHPEPAAAQEREQLRSGAGAAEPAAGVAGRRGRQAALPQVGHVSQRHGVPMTLATRHGTPPRGAPANDPRPRHPRHYPRQTRDIFVLITRGDSQTNHYLHPRPTMAPLKSPY